MSNNYYYTGVGCVYVAPMVNGVQTGGFVHLGDAEGLIISTSENFVDIWKTCGNTGTRVKAKHISQDQTFNFEMGIKELTPENLKKAFRGSVTEHAAATGVTAARTVFAKGDTIYVDKVKISNVTVAKTTAPSGNLVLGTDYTVDAEHGAITILETATHADLASLSGGVSFDVDFDHEASATTEFAKTGMKDFAFKFEGNNAATDLPEVVTIHNVSLHLASTLQLLDESAATLVVNGECTPDSNDDIISWNKQEVA